MNDKDFGDQDWEEFNLLQTATPAEIDARICQLMPSKQDDTKVPLPSLEYSSLHLVPQKNVQAFVQSYMFMVNWHGKPTTMQRREFFRGIYDYARAVGMEKHQANTEVNLARAAYRHDQGLPGGVRLDESDEESAVGSEIDDSVEYVASMKNGTLNGLVDQVGFWAEIRG